MFVTKRNGTKEAICFDKIKQRLENLSKDLTVNVDELTIDVIKNLSNNIRTSDLDKFAAARCCSKIIKNIDYGILAARIACNDHHKNTLNTFREK